MSNIVLFPKQKKDSPPMTIEQLYESVEGTRREQIEYLIDDVLSFVFQRCYEEGFDLGQDKCLKTTGLVVESFRAGLYNTISMEHPLHKVAETLFVEGTEEVSETETSNT